MKYLFYTLGFIFVWYGCEQAPALDETIQPVAELKDTLVETEMEVDEELSLEDLAMNYLEYIQRLDFTALTELNGGQEVLFSPYSFIDKSTAQSFSFSALSALKENEELIMWGWSDGEGNALEMSVEGFFQRFINDVNYLEDRDELNVGTMKQRGNSLVNVKEVFPSSTVVEFYRGSRNPDMAEMDWRALALVFEKIDQEYILVALIHNEWTI